MSFDDLIEKVSQYSYSMPELAKAHHFKFAKPHPEHSSGKTKFVVMGMNPGETKQDWKDHPEPLREETWRHDFREEKKLGTNSKKWRANIIDFCGTPDVVQTEAFFWSSANIGKGFEEKFGATAKCPCIRRHFEFCQNANSELIRDLDPKAVIAPGLKWSKFLASIYKLQEIETKYCEVKPSHRLIIRYTDSSQRPWIFTKHWSGARGFSQAQKSTISAYIKKISQL